MCGRGEGGWGRKETEQTIVNVWDWIETNFEDDGDSLPHTESRHDFESRGMFPPGEAKTTKNILRVCGVRPYGSERPFRGWESFSLLKGEGISEGGGGFFLTKRQGLV